MRKTKAVQELYAPSPAGGGKKQERAILTRQQLIDAARRIFARDGFELARIEDIAAAAGKTRGAFYAHFRDKEDVFFAIFEEYKSEDSKLLRLRINESQSEEERLDNLARVLCMILKDRRRMLLALEFKLYAIRHPMKQKRLADLHATMRVRCVETDIDKLIPEFAHATPTEKRTQTAQVGAILEGLALNYLFDTGCLSDEQMVCHVRVALQEALYPTAGKETEATE